MLTLACQETLVLGILQKMASGTEFACRDRSIASSTCTWTWKSKSQIFPLQVGWASRAARPYRPPWRRDQRIRATVRSKRRRRKQRRSSWDFSKHWNLRFFRVWIIRTWQISEWLMIEGRSTTVLPRESEILIQGSPLDAGFAARLI